jgi:hypothetical protein
MQAAAHLARRRAHDVQAPEMPGAGRLVCAKWQRRSLRDGESAPHGEERGTQPLAREDRVSDAVAARERYFLRFDTAMSRA